MQSETNYPSMANRLRRIIPAFILSNFLPFLQIWLGAEFNGFSKELRRAGKPEDGVLVKIAKYFLAAGVLTIITFVCWFTPFIMQYASPYIGGYSLSLSFYGYYEVDLATLIKTASIALPAIMGIVQTVLLFKAWKQIRVFFSTEEPQKAYRSGGVQGAGRVIWAMELSGFAYGLIVTGFIVMVIAFGLDLTSTSLAPFLTGLGELLSLAGIINQCIGMGQTARGFQNLSRPVAPRQVYPVAQQQYQRPQPQQGYGGVPRAAFAPAPAPAAPQIIDPKPKVAEPPRPRFCSGCGAELPAAPGLKFCPTCGSKI